MKKAAFSFIHYQFEKIEIDLNKNTSNEINISFEPKGKFDPNHSTFELIINFVAFNDKPENPFISILCKALFEFEQNIEFDDIPSYFYRNSIAIVFPYIRAFVSTVTLQANIPPLILPTMNLSSLEEPLKQNTVII